MARRAYPKAAPARKIVSVRGESGGMVKYSGTVRLRNNGILCTCRVRMVCSKLTTSPATFVFKSGRDSFGNRPIPVRAAQ